MRLPYFNTTLVAAAAFGLWNYGEHLNRPLPPVPSVTIQAPPQLAEAFLDAATTYRLDATLLVRQIRQESSFNPRAVSPVGAAGLAQIMPGTAKELGVTDRFDPRQSVMGGAKYLRQMLDQFGTIERALMAYNAGPGRMAQCLKGEIPQMPAESLDYVRKILDREPTTVCGRTRTATRTASKGA